jgi:hypothetical protein
MIEIGDWVETRTGNVGRIIRFGGNRWNKFIQWPLINDEQKYKIRTSKIAYLTKLTQPSFDSNLALHCAACMSLLVLWPTEEKQYICINTKDCGAMYDYYSPLEVLLPHLDWDASWTCPEKYRIIAP